MDISTSVMYGNVLYGYVTTFYFHPFMLADPAEVPPLSWNILNLQKLCGCILNSKSRNLGGT